MAKVQRVTDKLNIAISTISAAASVLNSTLEQMPDSEAKRALLIVEEQIDKGMSDAWAALRAIKTAAESI